MEPRFKWQILERIFEEFSKASTEILHSPKMMNSEHFPIYILVKSANYKNQNAPLQEYVKRSKQRIKHTLYPSSLHKTHRFGKVLYIETHHPINTIHPVFSSFLLSAF